MRTKQLLLFTTLLVSALLLAACPASLAVPVEPAAEAAEQAPAAQAPAKIAVPENADLVIWADAVTAPILEEAATAFAAEYGLTVAVTEKASYQIRKDFKAAGPAGEGPDIVMGGHYDVGDWVERGLLAEMDLGDTRNHFLDAAVQGFTYNGRLYGMPYNTQNVALVYNPTLVPQVPATWSEVMAMAAEQEAAGTVSHFFLYHDIMSVEFFAIQSAFGGYLFGQTDEGYDAHDVGLDSEGSLAAIRWLAQMVGNGHLDAITTVTYRTMLEQFEQGKAAMIFIWPLSLPQLREAGVPYTVASSLPGETQDAQLLLNLQGFMVSRYSQDPELAQTFLQEFVATEETMQALFHADALRPSAFLPVRHAIDDPDIAALAAAGENGLPWPNIPQMTALQKSWFEAIKRVALGVAQPEEAFRVAAEQIRLAIAEE